MALRLGAGGAMVLTAAAVLAVGLPFVLSEPATPVATSLEAEACDQLFRDLEDLYQMRPELGAEDLKARVLERTEHYIVSDGGDGERWSGAVAAALADLDAARGRMTATHVETAAEPESVASIEARREAWGRWREEQRAAADRLLEGLDETAAHRLLAEKRLLWLLSLDSGLRRSGSQ